ncbi:MAG: glycosyltransferase [Bacteroidetes bacterium]|nr:glycosyltransferase [Bacteroidota bacterium]
MALLLNIFIISSLIQFGFWITVFSRLAFYKEKEDENKKKEDEPVSVVICAHNEEKNLKKNLPHILNQSYRSFEVIVVNDHSTDNTEKVLLEFKHKNPILRIINFYNKNKTVGKKAALSKGIEAANHNILLLTDADCRPAGPNWILKMQGHLKENKTIGLGYGPYEQRKGGLNRFIRFETVYTAVQYFSFALLGLPYMGVGRNLIYRKDHYFQVGGFSKHRHLASGDDDLFINEVAHERNTKIILDKDTFVYSDPKTDWKGYYRQKSRHLSTGTSYRKVHQILLGLLSASHILHYVAGVILLILNFSTVIVLIIYTVRICVLQILYGNILKKLNERSLLKWVPILDAVFATYYLLFAPLLLIGKKNRWK